MPVQGGRGYAQAWWRCSGCARTTYTPQGLASATVLLGWNAAGRGPLPARAAATCVGVGGQGAEVWGEGYQRQGAQQLGACSRFMP